jgi:hypothetical protein
MIFQTFCPLSLSLRTLHHDLSNVLSSIAFIEDTSAEFSFRSVLYRFSKDTFRYFPKTFSAANPDKATKKHTAFHLLKCSVFLIVCTYRESSSINQRGLGLPAVVDTFDNISPWPPSIHHDFPFPQWSHGPAQEFDGHCGWSISGGQ